MARRFLPTVARVGLVMVLAGGAAVSGYTGTWLVRKQVGHHATATPAPPTPAALRAITAAPGVPPASVPAALSTAAGVGQALAGPAGATGLGPRLRASVLDAASGAVLYARDPTAPTAPASTAKLLTAAALLAVRPASTRLTTRVVAGPGGAIVLVGAGDPTLTGAAAGQPGVYPGAARISDLAAQLRRAGVHPTRIVVDDGLFAGPAIAPQWAPEDVPSDYAGAITAVLADGARPTPASPIRVAAPDLAAGQELAAALGAPSLPVARGAAPAAAATLASVRSASFGQLVEQMLESSDNVIAECLARQVALAEGLPASFAGAATAVRRVLTRLGLDPGAGLVDGSGLAAGDRVSTATLAGVLRLVTQRADLHALLAGLPVAGWSGTLHDRYRDAATRSGAGVVRAKTGTLTGVSSLAGTVHDRDGRLLVFAFVADEAPDTATAEAALDQITARLAGCGCR